MTSTQATRLRRITSFIVAVYAPMFFRIHLNPRAPEGPNNMLFLRDLFLDFTHIDDELMQVLKKIFVKHFSAWMNPTNVALNVHSKNPAFRIAHLQDPDQSLPESVDTEALALKRTPIKSYFSKASKQAPCVHNGNMQFWNNVNNHNRSCERFIGKMSKCLLDRQNSRQFRAEQKKKSGYANSWLH